MRTSAVVLPSVPVLTLLATLVYAGERPAPSPALPDSSPQQDSAAAPTVSTAGEPFEKGALGVELALGLLGEAWNLNRSREWLADGSFAIWWAFVNRATVTVEIHAIKVFQRPGRNAFVTGLTPVLRLQVLDRERWALFTEIGAGASWSDTAVPPRGTRFNYLGLAGLGVSRRLGRQTHSILGVRWLHVSNNGREGHDRNPDIQALGGYAALAVSF